MEEDKPYTMYNEEIDGVTEWLWPTSDKEAFIILRHEWPALRDAILKYVPERRVVIQAGGNCGMYPRLMANGFNIVYTFEPDPSNFFCLSYNCRQENIIKMQLALGAESGSVAISHVSPTNVGMHRVEGDGAIPLMQLDSFEFPCVDLIQLDIEEYEINAIKGAEYTISHHKPVVIVENATEEVKKWMEYLEYELAEDITRLDSVFVPIKPK